MPGKREGETELAADPAALAADAHVVFISRLRSAWVSGADCPKNMVAARATGQQAVLEVDPAYRPGLIGLAGASHVIILTWLDRAQRNLIVQKPRHATDPKGVFALRSPVRPNPIGLHVAGLLSVDIEAGWLHLDAIDVFDATPVIDIKPYFATTDAFPGALPARHRDAP